MEMIEVMNDKPLQNIRRYLDEQIGYHEECWQLNQRDYKKKCPELFAKKGGSPYMYLDNREEFYQNCAMSYLTSFNIHQNIRKDLYGEKLEFENGSSELVNNKI